MKILFLDHDGVICLSDNWGSRFKKQRSWGKVVGVPLQEIPVEYRFDNFDRKSVGVLNEILKCTGCEIVVISDWRVHCTLEEMGEFYSNQGIIKKPIGFTRLIHEFDESSAALYTWKGWKERARIVEIRDYLERNEVTSWVAVDDMNMNEMENFVQTKLSREGIKQCGIKEKIIRILNYENKS